MDFRNGRYKSFIQNPKVLFLIKVCSRLRLAKQSFIVINVMDRIRAQITRQWKPLQISSSFILKVIDCMPDELSPSSFIRFEIWDMGKLVDSHGEPFRLGHIVDVMVLRESISRGQVQVLVDINHQTH